MSLSLSLLERAGHACELCNSTSNLISYEVLGSDKSKEDVVIIACGTCADQLLEHEVIAVNHWRCLNESMWSEVPAVQVVAYRMLAKLSKEGWPQDLLDMLYLDEPLLAWAKNEGVSNEAKIVAVKHVDSNGVELQTGDSVVLIKDLKVKGASFVAKRGTPVRNISLVHDNTAHIEGKINGQQIVILTQYVKK